MTKIKSYQNIKEKLFVIFFLLTVKTPVLTHCVVLSFGEFSDDDDCFLDLLATIWHKL